jgi:outer membrane protein
VKKLIQSASAVAILAGILALGGNVVWSQSGKAPKDAKPHKVGLIDMAHVFKHYEKFDSMREDLKAKIGSSEEDAKRMAERIKTLQAELKELKEGKPGYDQKEKELAEISAKFEAFRRSTQREILKEESKIYHQVYMEVADAVKRYSKFYGYTLVLRFNREDLNPEDPQGLIQGMNRQVVFHQPEDDMTDSVLEHLNQKFGEGRPAAETKVRTEKKVKEANGAPEKSRN